MIPGKYNITIHRGGTWSIGINAENLDFTTYDEIRMQIRPPWVKGVVSSKPALFTLSMTNGRITLEDEGLTVRLTVSAADTAAITFDEGIYDLELVQHADLTGDPVIPEEIVDKLLYGSVTVQGEITA